MPYVPKTMAEVTPSWLEETLQESMGDEATDIKVGPEHCVAPREDMMKLVRQVLQWNDVQNIFIILIGKDVCIKLYEIEELHFQVIALDRCEDEFGLMSTVALATVDMVIKEGGSCIFIVGTQTMKSRCSSIWDSHLIAETVTRKLFLKIMPTSFIHSTIIANNFMDLTEVEFYK